MAYCVNCGSEISNNEICPICGVNEDVRSNQSQPYDQGGALYFLIGFIIPIVGVILFIFWNNTKPKSAKLAGIGALLSVPFAVIIMGIFAAFAIPAVGNIIDSTSKDMVYGDALVIETAAQMSCIEIVCVDDQELTWNELTPYVMNIDPEVYEISSNTVVARKTLNGWTVDLEPVGTGQYEFPNYLVPSNSTKDSCVIDTD